MDTPKNDPPKVVPIGCSNKSLEDVEEIEYCIGCKDELSGMFGTFAYDAYICAHGGGLFAISPVFESVDEFYVWSKEHGFKYYSYRGSFVLTKVFPG